MSIASVGGPASWNPSQMLSALLSRLDQQSSSATQTSNETSTSSQTQSSGSPAITGDNRPSLSSMVLGALMWAQNDGGAGTGSATANSSSNSTSQSQDPVQSLFSSMDEDGDGTVSQAEMEKFIESKGGTASEADTLYGMVTQNGANALTEQQLASQVPPPPGGPNGVGGGRHHGHHHHMSSTDGADALMKALDTDSNGTVDQTELTSFVTANGGTEDQANSIFSSLDSSKTGSITSADFAAAIEKLQGDSSSNSNALVMTMLSAFDRSTTDTQNVSVSA